ncbi:MAG: RnfABCDGE type electron transport complex subunit D [Spirochaetia bacterium]
MLSNTNHPNQEYLCPHSHVWYSSGKIHFTGTLILFSIVLWQAFLLSDGLISLFTEATILRVFIAWLISFIAELIRSFLQKKRTYLDNRFLFYPLLLTIVLPLNLPMHIFVLSLIFAHMLNSFIFGQRACILPFVSTGFAFGFLSSPSNFLNQVTHTYSPFINSFLEKYGLNSPEVAWLLPPSGGDALSTFILAYGTATVLLILAKVINTKIVVSAVAIYLLGCFIFLDNILQYPQTWFCLFIVLGDTQTTPFSRVGKIIFGLLVGIFTVLLQKYWYPQVAGHFAILLSCLFSPLINHISRPIFLKHTKRNHEVLL